MTASSTEVNISKKPKKVAKSVAKEIIKLTQQSAQRRFNIALSGGNTPKKLFNYLSEKYANAIQWERIHFWWGDERCVYPDDEQSNFKMANDLLFSKISIPKENIHRIRGENDPEEEALRYENEINDSLNHRGEIPVFDLVILGLGEDGHTASIFPGNLDIFGKDRVCIATKNPHTGQNRITLTGKVINNANRITFMVIGKEKSKRIAEIMNNDDAAKELPAYYIEPKNGSLIWYLDEDASSDIS